MLKIKFADIEKNILDLMIITIPFPIYFRVFGRDAFTLTTLLIYSAFAIHVLRRGIKPRTDAPKDHSKPLILSIVILMFIYAGSVFLTPKEYCGPMARHVVAIFSGFILFYLMFSNINSREEVLDKLALLSKVIIVEGLICLFIYFIPGLEKFTAIFATRGLDAVPVFSGAGSDIRRLAGTIADYELLPEWFVINIFILLILDRMNKLKFAMLFVFFNILIVMLSITRASIILMVLSFFAFLVINGREIKKIKYFGSAVIAIAAITAILVFIFPSALRDMQARFGAFSFKDSEAIAVSTNRVELWKQAYSDGYARLTLLGKGPYVPREVFFDERVASLHSLYLTILEQIGILGLSAFLLFMISLLGVVFKEIFLVKDRNDGYILKLFFLILFFFFVDQVKIEYLRQSCTIQFIWLMFGLIYAYVLSVRASAYTAIRSSGVI